jgi:hypothetical protein
MLAWPARTSFISTLKFKNKPKSVPGSQTTSTDVGLPISFSLADLETNATLELPAATKAQLNDVIQSLEADTSLSAEKSSQISTVLLASVESTTKSFAICEI